MRVKRRHSLPPRAKKKKIWVPQATFEMSFFLEKKLMTVFGTVVEIKARSISERWLSSMYMGVWRRESTQIKSIRIAFPMKVMI
jgi:hypothetical protein